MAVNNTIIFILMLNTLLCSAEFPQITPYGMVVEICKVNYNFNVPIFMSNVTVLMANILNFMFLL
jgi:hypothetical protein